MSSILSRIAFFPALLAYYTALFFTAFLSAGFAFWIGLPLFLVIVALGMVSYWAHPPGVRAFAIYAPLLLTTFSMWSGLQKGLSPYLFRLFETASSGALLLLLIFVAIIAAPFLRRRYWSGVEYRKGLRFERSAASCWHVATLLLLLVLGAGALRDTGGAGWQHRVIEAVKRGDTETLARYHERGVLALLESKRPIFFAFKEGQPESAAWLLERDLVWGSSYDGLMGDAIEHDSPELIALLFDHGASADGKVYHGRTTHGYASALHLAVTERRRAAFEFLLERGADPNPRDWAERTPLYLAVERSELPMVRRLLEKGADPDAASREGASPLERAALWKSDDLSEDQFEIARELLAAGANPKVRSIKGRLLVEQLIWVVESRGEGLDPEVLARRRELNRLVASRSQN